MNFNKAVVLSVLVPTLMFSQVPTAFARTTSRTVPRPTVRSGKMIYDFKKIGGMLFGKIVSFIAHANGSFDFNIGKNGEVKVALFQETSANNQVTSRGFDIQVGNNIFVQGKLNPK